MTQREILIAIFSEDVCFDTPQDAADLMLSRLFGHGFRIVPSEPTDEAKEAWRKSQKEHKGGPLAAWRAMLDATD